MILQMRIVIILIDCTASSQPSISGHCVRSVFNKCNIGKSPGPDRIIGTFLKVCGQEQIPKKA